MNVLIVDDNADSAATFATMVGRVTGLNVGSTANPRVALEHVEREPIAVVVLDERMPEMAGTELFSRIKAIDHRIQAVMLTGEADLTEVGNALNVGYAAFLAKKDVQQLPALVLERFVDHQAHLAIELANEAGRDHAQISIRPKRLRRPRVLLAVIQVDVIEHNSTPDDAWHTVEQINVGETITTISEAATADSVLIEINSLRSAGSHLDLTRIPAPTVALKAEIERRVRTEHRLQATQRRATERKLTLPQELPDRDRPQLRSRSREEAPSYLKTRVIVRVSCECCQQITFHTLLAYVHDGSYLTRQVDCYSDGERRIVNTTRVI
jgi:CheY-like chemotaxis protein